MPANCVSVIYFEMHFKNVDLQPGYLKIPLYSYVDMQDNCNWIRIIKSLKKKSIECCSNVTSNMPDASSNCGYETYLCKHAR